MVPTSNLGSWHGHWYHDLHNKPHCYTGCEKHCFFCISTAMIQWAIECHWMILLHPDLWTLEKHVEQSPSITIHHHPSPSITTNQSIACLILEQSPRSMHCCTSCPVLCSQDRWDFGAATNSPWTLWTFRWVPVSLRPWDLVERAKSGSLQIFSYGSCITWPVHMARWIRVCLKMGYTPQWNSHLVGIMIINHWVFDGYTIFRQTRIKTWGSG